jgi:hypothetical protein
MQDNCYIGDISLKEIEDHKYTSNESLISEKSKNNRVLMSRTNNFMPHFIDNLIKYSKLTLIQSIEENLNALQITGRQNYKQKSNQS